LGNGRELSGGDLVLGREAAEDLSSADLVLGEVYLRRSAMSVSWWQLAKGAVWPGGVVVRQVFAQYLAQVALADDEQPVEEFAPQGPDDPFADGVRSGCLRRAGKNPDAGRQEEGVETGGELARAILIRNLTPVVRGPGSIRRLRAVWVVHALSGLAVIPAR